MGVEQGQGGGGTAEVITIPQNILKQLRQLGYTGPSIIYDFELENLLAEYGIELKPGESADDQIPTSTPTIVIGGGSADVGMTAAQKAELRAMFLNLIHNWGLALTDNLRKLVDQGVKGEWGSNNFILHLRATREYKDAFVGIQKGQSEETYLAAFNVYRDRLKDIGRTLNREQFGLLQNRGVDFEEWNIRVSAIDAVERDRQLFNQFEQTLRARGIIKGQLSLKEMVNFVRGSSSPAFERVWEEAAFTAGLKRAGVSIGKAKGADFSRKEIVKLIGQFESRMPGAEVENLGDQFYQQLATDIRTLIPASRLANFKLTNSDILEMELGGPRAAKIAQTVEQILANAERAEQGTPAPQAQLTQDGVFIPGLEDERPQ